MAHELDFSTGRAAIAYTGEKPWHGYGEAITEEQPLEVWRTLAGLDYEVEERPVFYYDGKPLNARHAFPKRKALIRSDNSSPLAIVSDRYKVVQPKEVIEFFESVIKENGFKMSTAGALKGGKRVWAMADCHEDFVLPGTVDRVGAHLLLATSYDGTFATTAQFTSVRVVCNNTLGFSLERGGEGGVVRVPHTQDFNQWDIKADLGFDSSWVNFRDNVTKLASHRVTKREALNYFLTVMGVTEEEAADGKQLSNVKKLISLYESGPGSKFLSAKDTLWGALNAVTFMVDHTRAAANNGNRFDSASFGGGAKVKREAFKEAVRIAA